MVAQAGLLARERGVPANYSGGAMLKIENLTKVYDDGTRALNNVSLTIPDGQFVVIIGLRGWGKPPLLRCINRLIEPTSGKIWLDSVDVTAANAGQIRQIRRNIG